MQAITKVFSDIVKPYIDSENQTLANVRATLGAHNLLPNNAKSINNNGISYIRNPDGSITVSGTATAESWCVFNIEDTPIEAGNYILTGCPEGGGLSNSFVLRVSITDGNNSVNYDDTGNGVNITVPNSYKYRAYTGIRVASGKAITTPITFYPMIRLASDTDTTYQPYAKSNTELTQDDIGLTANAFANGCVNLLKNEASSATVNGITFTVNSDGTVSAIGTANADAALHYPVSIPKGKYKLSGCPSGGSYSTYRIQFQSSSRYYSDEGNGREIDDNITHVYMSVYNGQTVNIVFKPMITVADMPNSDYEHYVPYAMTNRELTPKVGTVTATTNSNGLIALSSLVKVIWAYVGYMTSHSHIGLIIGSYTGVQTTIKVIDNTTGNAIANESITITYLYLDF